MWSWVQQVAGLLERFQEVLEQWEAPDDGQWPDRVLPLKATIRRARSQCPTPDVVRLWVAGLLDAAGKSAGASPAPQASSGEERGEKSSSLRNEHVADIPVSVRRS